MSLLSACRVMACALFLTGASIAAPPATAAQPAGDAIMITLPREVLPFDVGANGFVAAGGFFSGGAFHWMPTGGTVDIGALTASGVSRDGKTIVGSALDRTGLENAAIWTGAKTWRTLGSIGGARPCDALLSSALDVNADGRVVVGLAWDGCSYARA